MCVETLSKDQGYQCIVPNVQGGLTVRPPIGVPGGELDDFIQQFIDRVLQVSSLVLIVFTVHMHSATVYGQNLIANYKFITRIHE